MPLSNKDPAIHTKAILFLSAAMFLSACGSSGDDGGTNAPVEPRPGKFSISLASSQATTPDIQKTSSSPTDEQVNTALPPGIRSAANVFSLGNIHGSRTIYFLLSNNGDLPIRDVSIEPTNTTNLKAIPNHISILEPASNQSTITMLIGIDIIHGSLLDGIGKAPILPMGDNELNLQITGTTTSGDGTEIALTTSMQLNLTAMVADYDMILDNDQLVDLTSPSAVGFGSPSHRYITISNTATLINTGNVPININDRQGENIGTLAPEESYLLSTDGKTYGLYGYIYQLEFYNNGTAFDPDRHAWGNTTYFTALFEVHTPTNN